MSVADKRRSFRALHHNSVRDIAGEGKFDSFAGVMPNAELNTSFHDDLPRRLKP